jgi:ClpA/ClpB-like protein/ClpX C4-type zinc finger protein
VFERFTDQARRVVVLAQEEARLLNHPYIGSEHTLLGLLAEGHGVGAQALVSLGVTMETARAKVVALVGRGERVPSGHIPFTPQAKRALEGALREALHLGDHEIGTEHLLLGLIREGDSTAARTLEELEVDLDAVRARVVDIRAGRGGEEPPRVVSISTGRGVVTSVRETSSPGRSAVCSFCGRDLWEVERFVTGSQASICDGCVVSAVDALEHAPAQSRGVPLPPRVFGDTPDGGAVDAVAEAVCTAFDSTSDDDARAGAVEDGVALAPLYAEAKARHPDVVTRLDRVRFDSANSAEVRLSLLLGGGIGPAFEGRVTRLDGGWTVGRELFCSVVSAVGVVVPSGD